MKEDITQKILSIYGNFELSEVERLNELEILYMKQEEEIERLNNIIKEVREYIKGKEKDDDNWVDYELLIEPRRIKEILKGSE